MPSTPDATRRAILVAAGREGGLTGTKDTTKARAAQLIKEGADVDATGAVIPGPNTTRAKARLAARLQKARAQKRHAAAQADEQAGS